MPTTFFDEQLIIPTIQNLREFRDWALSEGFPDRGRIDYIAGQIEVDISPQDLFTHGSLKTELASEIKDRVHKLDLGHVFVGETRISSVPADLSAEPDVVVLSYQALDDGRARLVPKGTREEGRFIEIEGGPDLVVEIIGDGSVQKDTQRLPKAYFAAGVREYWLVDARGQELFFQIGQRQTNSFEPTPADADGFQRSEVLDGSYRLDRNRHQRGHWVYQLRSK